MSEPHSSRWVSWTFVIAWLTVFLWDISMGLPGGAGFVLLLAAAASLAMAWRWPSLFRFALIQRLLLVPVIAWGIFVSFALLLDWLASGLPRQNLWAIKPFLSWAGLVAALVVAAGTAVMLLTLFRSQLLRWAGVAASIAALSVIAVEQHPRLYSVIESVFLVVAVCVMTYAASRIAPKLPVSGNAADRSS
jgi:hypothetical protein